MARIKLQTEDVNNSEIQKIFDEIKKIKGFVPAPYRAFAKLPHILQANWNKTIKVSKQGNLPGKIKESIAFIVSITNKCSFCINIHTENLKNMGFSKEEIISISEKNTENEKTNFILNFVSIATKNANKITDNDFDKLRIFGYTDEDILEILTVMEMYTGYNKIVTSLGIELDD